MLDALKKMVCRANRELERRGLVALTWGNVSGLDRKRRVVAIKPSGVAYADLRPCDIVLVDLSGRVIEGRLRPSSDMPTHLALYRAFPEIGGVTHAHSAYATMFAQAGRGIPCYGTTHADQFHGEVPVTRPMTSREVAEAYEANTGSVIVERLGRRNPMETPAVLVSGHGAFTWGRDAENSLENAVALEAVARMAFGTLALNPSATPIPSHLLEKHFLRKHGAEAYYGQR